MKNDLWEARLYQHGDVMRQTVQISVSTALSRPISHKRHITRVLVLAAVLAVTLACAAFAGYRYHSAAELADRQKDTTLSRHFQNAEGSMETIESGSYRITLLGAVSGTDISDQKTHGGAKLVACVAVERIDGSAMSYEDHLVISPLYGGIAPSEANAYTDSGSGSYFIEDGVLYYSAELRCRLGYEAHDLYLAVSDTPPCAINYLFHEQTGAITPNLDYSGTNALFLLQRAK